MSHKFDETRLTVTNNEGFSEPRSGIVGAPKELNLESRRDSLEKHRSSRDVTVKSPEDELLQHDDLENNFLTGLSSSGDLTVTSMEYLGFSEPLCSIEKPSESSKINSNSSTSSPKDSVRSSDSDFMINVDLTSENFNINIIGGENCLNDRYNNSSFYIKRTNSESENWFKITDLSFHSSYILNSSPINSCSNSDSESNNGDRKYKYNGSDSSGPIGYSSGNKLVSNLSSNSLISRLNNTNGYKKLSYKDVEKFIEKYYNVDGDNKYSSEIDILSTYINGQKNLYIQSKYITQYKLNLLTFPSIFVTAAVTIIAPFIECNVWSAGVISALNALLLLFISLINYLKYETSIEAYIQYAKQYDKIGSSLEMANNKLLFIKNDSNKNLLVLNKIGEIEKKIGEIKDTNNSLIPEEIKRLFPVICNINIFSFIKKIESNKKILINKLKDIKNEIRFILYKWENENFVTESVELCNRRLSEIMNVELLKEKNRLQFLYETKKKTKDEIIELSNSYSYIDTIFSKEIKIADSKKNSCFFYFFNKKVDNSYFKTNNPVIDKYLNFILSDS